ncbi:hypothetical protein BC629DRAFT_230220 [Irpex lacteus]|nr:hypothetical protein BC629DRAFT_230220 [Irpex lacteus]
MERADIYQQSAFDTLCHVSRRLGAKERQDGAVGCLMTVHDSLIEERDRLVHLFDDTPRKQSAHELVEQANGYKAKVKMFYCNVQQALEDCDIAHSPSIEVSPLSHYKFPEPSVDELKADEDEASHELHAAQDSFAYSALGLYNLEPPSQRFGGSRSEIQDEPTELAFGLLSKFDIGSDVPISNGPFYDEPQELEGMTLDGNVWLKRHNI